MELEKLREWIGRKESDVSYVTMPSVRRLAAMLGRHDPMPTNGDPLPIGPQQIPARLWVVNQDGAPTPIADAEFKSMRRATPTLALPLEWGGNFFFARSLQVERTGRA